MVYALITGASKGIGREIAEQLAARNINVLLVARSGPLLQEAAEALKKKYGIQADWIALDLASPAAPRDLFDQVSARGYRVNILVNNAGYGLSGAFERYTPEEQRDMMQVNMGVPVQLCSLFLPELKTHAKSYVLNIASAAAYQAVPGLSVYAATKAFILSFSRGLRYELRKTPVSVTVVSPGGTDTDFANRAQVGPRAVKAGQKVNMTAADVAAQAVDAMFAGKAELVTGFINKLGAFLVWLLPKGLAEKTAAGLYQ